MTAPVSRPPRHVTTMRILITGGTGFIGQALCPRLAAAGHQVVILTRQSTPALPRGAASAVTRLDTLEAGDFGAVINLAGAPSATRAGRRDASGCCSGRASARPRRGGRMDAVVRRSRRASSSRARPWATTASRATGRSPRKRCRRPGSPMTSAQRGRPRPKRRRSSACECAGCGSASCWTGAVARWRDVARVQARRGRERWRSGAHYFPWIHREDIVAICQWLLERPESRGAYNAGSPQPGHQRAVHASARAGTRASRRCCRCPSRH